MPVAGGGNTYFLKIEGIAGASQDLKRKDEIDVESWSCGKTNAVPPRTGGGGGAGRVSMQDFLFTTSTSKASPKFFLSCASGERFKTALLSASRGSGGKQVEYLKIKPSDVLVTSYQTSAPATAQPALDQVSLNFAKIEVEYPGGGHQSRLGSDDESKDLAGLTAGKREDDRTTSSELNDEWPLHQLPP